MNILLRGALLSALIISGTPAAAEPMLWRVSDADSAVHLFGSVHVLKPDMDWRTENFEAILDAAELVYFEIDMGTGGAVEMGELMLNWGSFPEGQTIADVLTDDQYDELQSFFATVGIPPTSVAHLKPWMLELTIGQSFGSGGELFRSYEQGVDFILAGEVARDRQRALETLEEQLGGLYRRPMYEQVASLMDTVAVAERPLTSEDFERVEVLFDAWAAGDGHSLEQLANNMGGPDAYMYDEMLTKRNQRWIKKIEVLLDDDVEALIVGGAGHFVGPTSVTALLAERGYTVELISAPFVPPPAKQITTRARRW